MGAASGTFHENNFRGDLVSKFLMVEPSSFLEDRVGLKSIPSGERDFPRSQNAVNWISAP